MDKSLILDYYNKDELCTHIEVDNWNVKFINYTDDPIYRAFGNRTEASRENVYEFLVERCFPETRANCSRVLNMLGLDHYDAYLICKKTHGVLWEDYCWIRFNNEQITWEDVKLRD